jgi:hypothetical protein
MFHSELSQVKSMQMRTTQWPTPGTILYSYAVYQTLLKAGTIAFHITVLFFLSLCKQPC